MLTLRVAYGYGRESTLKQQLSGLGMEAQVEKIETYIKRLGCTYGGMFKDSAVSGMVRMTDRKAGEELDRVVRKGDIIVVSRLDRAFRRTADAMVMVERWAALGVELHVVDFAGQEMNLMSGIGKFILTILVAFAELERSYISERTRIAMAQSKRKYGWHHVRHPGYGFKWERTGGKKVRVPDERQLELMRQFYEWHSEMGLSVDHIAQHMNYTLKIKNEWGEKKAEGRWSPKTVYNWCIAEMQRRIKEYEGDPEAEIELAAETEPFNDGVYIIGQSCPSPGEDGLDQAIEQFNSGLPV